MTRTRKCRNRPDAYSGGRAKGLPTLQKYLIKCLLQPKNLNKRGRIIGKNKRGELAKCDLIFTFCAFYNPGGVAKKSGNLRLINVNNPSCLIWRWTSLAIWPPWLLQTKKCSHYFHDKNYIVFILFYNIGLIILRVIKHHIFITHVIDLTLFI